MATFIRTHVSRFGKFIGAVSATCGFASYSLSTIFAREKKIESGNSFMTDPITPRDKLESSSNDMKTKMELFVMQMQRDFCDELSRLENGSFIVDKWEREGGGGGITCVIQDGK